MILNYDERYGVEWRVTTSIGVQNKQFGEFSEPAGMT